ncbi:DUF6957 family protein [Pseudomonas sp. GG8]
MPIGSYSIAQLAARISDGGSFITSYQKDFHGCFFESKDKLYILAGRGARKHVSVPAVAALHENFSGLVR